MDVIVHSAKELSAAIRAAVDEEAVTIIWQRPDGQTTYRLKPKGPPREHSKAWWKWRRDPGTYHLKRLMKMSQQALRLK